MAPNIQWPKDTNKCALGWVYWHENEWGEQRATDWTSTEDCKLSTMFRFKMIDCRHVRRVAQNVMCNIIWLEMLVLVMRSLLLCKVAIWMNSVGDSGSPPLKIFLLPDLGHEKKLWILQYLTTTDISWKWKPSALQKKRPFGGDSKYTWRYVLRIWIVITSLAGEWLC